MTPVEEQFHLNELKRKLRYMRYPHLELKFLDPLLLEIDTRLVKFQPTESCTCLEGAGFCISHSVLGG